MEKEQKNKEKKLNIEQSQIKYDEPMKKHTTFKVGGNADIFITIKKEEKNIIDISDGNKKTIILTKEKDGMKYYITSILSGTLEKRTKIL